MSFLAAAIPAIAGSAASFGLSKLFGGNSSAPTVDNTLQGFNAGGLTATGTGDITASPDRTGLVSSIGSLYGQQGDILGGLRQTVAPGFNDLLKSRLDQINNAAASSVGDLRQNLSARRVLGSSFGQDTISRANAEFSSQRDQAIADNFLKSLAVNQQLTQQEFDARRGQFQTALDELNLEANAGLSISGKANSILAQNAKTQADLDAKSATGAGQFFGQLIQPVGKAIGTATGNLFSSFGSSGSPSFDPAGGF